MVLSLVFAMLTFGPNAEAAIATSECLFATKGSLATGADLRARGVHTMKVLDVRNEREFGNLTTDVQQSVKDLLVKTHASLKDFFNNQGLVEYYAAGSATGENAGAYIIITYSPKGILRGRVYRHREGKYIAVVEVRNGTTENCKVPL